MPISLLFREPNPSGNNADLSSFPLEGEKNAAMIIICITGKKKSLPLAQQQRKGEKQLHI